MTGRLFLSSVMLIAGCKRGPGELVSADIRIDGADAINDPDSDGTKMCVADDGTVYVLWTDDREDSQGEGKVDVWMNRSNNLGAVGSWLPAPVQVNHSESRVWNPNLYCNNEGVYVVWEDDRDGTLRNHQIYFNYSTDQGETFLPEDILLEASTDPDGNSMSLEPQITGYGSDLFVTWSDTLYGAPDILVASSIDGGATWSDPTRVDSDDPGEAYSAHPRIATSLDGQDVWVVWEDARDGATDIYMARSETGGVNFEPDERLDEGDEDGATDSLSPQICTDRNLNVYVVWQDLRNGEAHDILMNYSGDRGVNWQAVAGRLDSDAAGFGNSGGVVCSVEGSTLHAAWHDKRGTDFAYDIYYRKAQAGIPGDAEIRLDTAPPEGHSNSLDPQMALHNGQVVVAWRDSRGEVEAQTDNGFEDLFYNYSSPTSNFDDEGDFRLDSMLPAMSAKQDLNISVLGGSLYAAWTDSRNGTLDIYFTALALGQEAEPPVESN
jgi:hypothetical protein